MTQKLRVSFNSPQSGFMSIGLKAGKSSFVTAVAYAPYDSVRDLIKALSDLLKEEKTFVVKWNREPDEYDFEMSREGEDVHFKVVRYPNHRRLKSKSEIVFSYNGTLLDVCEPLWKALRELHRDIAVDEFDKNWRRDFPEEEMQNLTEGFREVKHRAKSQAK